MTLWLKKSWNIYMTANVRFSISIWWFLSGKYKLENEKFTRNITKMSELVWGIKNGDLDQVKDIVEKKAVNLNEQIDGRPPIHYAADYGQKDVIEYLISVGANVNSTDKHGITPILAAIWEGHIDCVKLLLDKGAKKDGVAPDGKSYLESAENNEIKALLA